MLREIKIIYLGVYLLMAVFFLKTLYIPIMTIYPETDLWWMMPTFNWHLEDIKSFSQFLGFLFSPQPPMYGLFFFKAYFIPILYLFGTNPQYFIFASLIMHFMCSGLVFLVSRKMGLNFQVSIFSSLTFLTLFAHFNYYTWPSSVHHIPIVFFVLLVLSLYLHTGSMIKEGKGYYSYYTLTLLANLAASFNRANIFVLPLMILAHILICSRDDKERIKNYDIWRPLFIIYLGYPLYSLTQVGDPVLTATMSFLGKITAVKYPILFIAGLLSLFLFRAALVQYNKLKESSRRLLIGTATGILIIAIAGFLYQKNIKLLILPYLMGLPFVSILLSFLEPLQTAFSISSISPYYKFPWTVSSAFGVLFALSLLVIFIRVFVLEKKQLIVLLIWYVMSTFFFIQRQDFIASRYFVHISPVFCIIFSSVMIYLYDNFMDSIRVTGNKGRAVILALIFVLLCVPNILAIRLEMWRGRLTNTFYIYDDIKTANLIKTDLSKSNNNPVAKNIYINNVVLMPFKEYWDFSPADPFNYDNFRFLLAQFFDNKSMRGVNINKVPAESKGQKIYSINEEGVTNEQGSSIERFSALSQEGLKEMRLRNNKKAAELFNAAAKEKPFLLKYVLSGHELKSLKWLTDGLGLREWVRRIYYTYNWDEKPAAKNVHVSKMINNEIDSYVLCLFYLSYLEHLSGNDDESYYWFCQIRFLESDYMSWLSQSPAVKNDKKMLAFLYSIDNYRFKYRAYARMYGNLPESLDFGNFLFKLTLTKQGWQVI